MSDVTMEVTDDASATRIDPGESLPPLGTVGLLRWLWKQLTSMRTALILLFLLAVASIPGTVLPQRGINPIKVNQYLADNPTVGPILDRLGFFDVFGSPWFSAVYLLLFISLIGCVIPRVRVHWRAMMAPPPAAPRNQGKYWTSRRSHCEGGVSVATVMYQSPPSAATCAKQEIWCSTWR
jgi:cytochrome c biogenesis protein